MPAQRPVAWHVTHWTDDPWSRGGWSVVLPGGSPADRAMLAVPIDGCVVLAGEATHPEQPAMTHGAWETGERAAAQVLAGEAASVVVVGGGFAGLGAARTLVDAGADVVLVDARPRLGGRAHTVDLTLPDDPHPVRVDAGAAWLQQFARNGLARRAEQLGLHLVPTAFDRPSAAARSGPPGDVAGALARLAAVADRADPRPLTDVLGPVLATMSTAERRTAGLAIDLDLVLESGCELDRLSTWAFHEPGVGQDDHWLPDGYASLVDDAVAGPGRHLDVHLGTAVQEIRWTPREAPDGRRRRVTVTLSDRGTLHADACICTVPLGVLPHIRFVPGLPTTHLAALGRMTLGTVEKVILRFTERWWPRPEHGYLRWYDEPASWGEWLDLTDGLGVPVVAGLIAGDAVARHHAGRTDEEIALAATEALASWAAAVATSGPG